MGSSDPPAPSSGVADTMPASEPSDAPERERRATIPDLVPPSEDRYKLGAELGRGGMGRVIEAFDVQLGRTVALKEVLPRGGPNVERRFEREVQITARLEHPSIVPLYDAGRRADGRPFYVMRKVTGRPLDALLARAKELPERLALLPNLLAAFDAIAHAHRRGIIHRDLKPANILVGDNGETIVIDWGLAKVLGESFEELADAEPAPSDSLQTQAGAVFGTPGFMPPEQARGESSTARGDVFALGATLYQLLAGRPPISASGPTEAIVSTIQRRIVPIAAAAPNAPAELHAIVEKALEREPEDRYADAERLAEDLRRFQTGQLVAAHRYTRRERIARFARRNRAALSATALALTAVAGVAWFSVHRILVERDLANVASDEANRQRAAAEQSNRELRDHDDALMLSRARAQIDTNPTVAIAMLRDLRSDSPRMAEARALAASAVARGVPWSLRAEGMPRQIELDPTASKAAEVTADGVLRVWDLVTRHMLHEHAFHGNIAWLADGRVFLVPDGNLPPTTLDPKTGRLEPFAIGVVSEARADEAGDRLAVLDDHKAAKIVDVATGKLTDCWPGHRVSSFAISPDGAWLAVSDATQAAVIDASTGAVVLTRPGELVLFASSDARFAGTELPTTKPVELVRDGGAWIDRPVATRAHAFGMAYRGSRLEAMTTDGVQIFDRGRYMGRRELPVSAFAAELAHDTEVVESDGGVLAFFNDSVSGTLALPVALRDLRLAGRRGKTRLVVAGEGRVLVYDLADVLPRFVPKDGMFAGAFGDRDSMLLWPGGDMAGFSWWNVATGTHVELDDKMSPLAGLIDRDPADGRMLIYDRVDNKTAKLDLVRVGQHTVQTLGHAGITLFGVLTAEGVLFGEGIGSRVLYSEHGGEPHELAKVDGGVAYVRVLDRRRFAALGKSGELVRGDIAGGALERTRIAATSDTLISATSSGDVVIATGVRLDVWATGGMIRPLAVLPRPITRVEAAGDGLVVGLEDNSMFYVEPSGRPHEIVAPSSFPSVVGGHGSWLATPGATGQIEIVELPAMAHWSLPRLFTLSGSIEVSPTGRRLAAASPSGFQVIDLLDPATGSDLAAWIDDHTNAFESPDGALGWR